jgi:flagellar hook-associated protein 2
MSTSSILNSVLSATSGSNDTTSIDVTSAVDAILYADRAPERAWQAQQATLSSQTTEINQLQSESSTLTDALNDLQDSSGALGSITATSSNSSIVTASAVAGTSTGSHTVSVSALATTAGAYTASVATSSTQLASGSFDITVGSGSPVGINVGSGDGTDDTLDELASTINGKSLGVTASVVTDSSGSRLSIVANTSGSAAGFTISSDNSELNFTQPSTGTDASLTFDSVPITSASNTVTINGVTLNLLGTTSSSNPVSLTLAPDSDAIEQAVSTFVSAYNTLITDVNSNFAYNSTTQTAGALQSDSTIQSFQSDLLSAADYSTGTGTLQTTLTSLGITTNEYGTLSLDTSTLDNAVTNNYSAVQNFFQGTNADGFVSSIEKTLNIYTDPTQGSFTVDLSSISAENTDLTNQTTTLEAYLSTQQTALTTEYNNADIALSQLPQEIKQIDALLNPSSSSNS